MNTWITMAHLKIKKTVKLLNTKNWAIIGELKHFKVQLLSGKIGKNNESCLAKRRWQLENLNAHLTQFFVRKYLANPRFFLF